MAKSTNLISNSELRALRTSEKQCAVLRFLRQHLWSSQSILQKVMNLSSRQAAHKTLRQMQVDGLVNVHQYQAIGGKITLWGITAHGQGMAFDPSCEEPVTRYFEPSKVSDQSIRHQLELQNLRLVAESSGWNSWTDGDRLGILDKNNKRPDAIAIDDCGVICAIECERTLKTTKRYEQILISYLMLLKSGSISKVIWISPDEDIAVRLQKLITNIKFVRIAGQRIQIDPAKHHANLHFTSYSKWSSFLTNS